MAVGLGTGIRSSVSRSCWTWSCGALVGLVSTTMLVKMNLLDSVLVRKVALGELPGVVMGVVSLYVTRAGFVLGVAVGFLSSVNGMEQVSVVLLMSMVVG